MEYTLDYAHTKTAFSPFLQLKSSDGGRASTSTVISYVPQTPDSWVIDFMSSTSIVSVGTRWPPNSQSHPIFLHRPVQQHPLLPTEGFSMNPGQGSRFSVSSL